MFLFPNYMSANVFKQEKDALCFQGLMARLYKLFAVQIADPRSEPTHTNGLNIHALIVDNATGQVLGMQQNSIHAFKHPIRHAERLRSSNHLHFIFVVFGLLFNPQCKAQQLPPSYQKLTSVWTITLAEYKDRLAQTNPTITGGCVTLTTATLATDLLVMVLKVSTVHSKGAMKNFIDSLTEQVVSMRDTLAMLADTDNYIFQDFIAAYHLPHETTQETTQRTTVIHNLLIRATNSPIDAADRLCQLFYLIQAARRIVSENVKSDVASCLLLLDASFKALTTLAKDNISQMPEAQRPSYEKRLQDLISKEQIVIKSTTN